MAPAGPFTLGGTALVLLLAQISVVDSLNGFPARQAATSPTSPGTWQSAPMLPIAVGEVSAGVINGMLYILGDDSSATLAYDLQTQQWRSDLAQRPLIGDHHAAEVINGKLYLFGGLGGGSAGHVQIYNPATNTWSLGSPAPYSAGSVSTALIGARFTWRAGSSAAAP